MIRRNTTKLPKKTVKKFCMMCRKEISNIEHTDVNLMSKFISLTGRIRPSAHSGCCKQHQKKLSTAIKRARIVGLLPFIPSHR